MIIDRGKEDPGVITATNQDMSRKNCWKIHGKPADWKPSKSINDKDRRANNVYSDNNRDKNTILPTETSPFSKEQLEILQQLFSQNSLSQPSMSASGSGSGLLAQKGSGYGEEDWQC
nr:uncharacterized protein LOC118032708 [Populus alba]